MTDTRRNTVILSTNDWLQVLSDELGMIPGIKSPSDVARRVLHKVTVRAQRKEDGEEAE